MLLLALILAESHGSLLIHVPDWKNFLDAFEAMRAAVFVCALTCIFNSLS